MTSHANNKNITWHFGKVTSEDRYNLLKQYGCVIWLTGLSGSGKSTVGYTLEQRLINEHHLAFVLDGDNVRHGLNEDLGFSEKDRKENIRRIGRTAALFAQAGVIAITSFIAPYDEDRITARLNAQPLPFVEVFLSTPLDICEQRDPKGLYKKARAGEIKNFTGIDAPYETPQHPELVIDTSKISPEQASKTIIKYLRANNIINHDAHQQAGNSNLINKQNRISKQEIHDQFYINPAINNGIISQREA